MTWPTFTLGNVKTSLQAKGFGSDAAASAAQTQAVCTILRTLYGKRRWKFLEAQSTALTLTAGAESISLTGITDMLHLDAVRIQTGTEYDRLDFIDSQELREMVLDDRAPDEPINWSRQGNNLLVYPIADRTYPVMVDYVQRPTLPAADGDAIVWPYDYMDVLVWGAVFEIAFKQRDWFAMQFAQGEYQGRIMDMETEYAIEQRQSSRQVQTWEGWQRVER